jgi:pimeloyl-ACP methyl ester carboxylesterase
VAQVIRVPDGRSLTVDSWGDEAGVPVFLLHGTPGSRSGPKPRSSVLYRLGVRLICYDRPGYGGSSRHPDRIVADAAWDVLAVADELGLDQFSVVGRSGGGPHALACTALLPERVRSSAVLVGIAPSDAKDLDWYSGMTRSNVTAYDQASSATVKVDLTMRADRIRADPAEMIKFLAPELTVPDRRIVADGAIRRQLMNTYAEACRNGAYGWIDDVLAFRRSWGIDLSAIKAPVLFWHGAEDVFSPVAHTLWLASQIRDAVVDVHIQPGAAHFDAVGVLPNVLARVQEAAAQHGRWSKPNGTAPGSRDRSPYADIRLRTVARDSGIAREFPPPGYRSG